MEAGRDAARSGYQAALTDAAVDLLLTDGMEALRRLLSVGAVHQRCADQGRPVPRATAYRLLEPPGGGGSAADVLIGALLDRAADPSWTGFAEAQESANAAFVAALDDAAEDDAVERPVIEALRANLEAQLSSPGVPLAFLLQAAAMTASPAWQGAPRARPELAGLAGDVLESRRRFYAFLTTEMASGMALTLSTLQRRPRPGLTAETLTALLHAMLDGAVIRLFLDPDALDPGLVAEAMFQLVLAFSEPGTHWDVRRRPEVGDEYDRLVLHASAAWLAGAEPGSSPVVAVPVADVAATAGVDGALARGIFPTDADLADSVLRTQVMAGGLPPSASTVTVTELAGLLWQLAQAVEHLPGAVALVTTEPVRLGSSIVVDLRSFAVQLVTVTLGADAAAETAATVVGYALEGPHGWRRALPILRLLGLPARSASPP